MSRGLTARNSYLIPTLRDRSSRLLARSSPISHPEAGPRIIFGDNEGTKRTTPIGSVVRVLPGLPSVSVGVSVFKRLPVPWPGISLPPIRQQPTTDQEVDAGPAPVGEVTLPPPLIPPFVPEPDFEISTTLPISIVDESVNQGGPPVDLQPPMPPVSGPPIAPPPPVPPCPISC